MKLIKIGERYFNFKGFSYARIYDNKKNPKDSYVTVKFQDGDTANLAPEEWEKLLAELEIEVFEFTKFRD